MPVYPLLKATGGGRYRRVGTITIVGKYNPGDQPPVSYNDKCEWAEVQLKAGLRQVQCSICSKYKFPQELHDSVMGEHVAYRTAKDARLEQNPVVMHSMIHTCNECKARTECKTNSKH